MENENSVLNDSVLVAPRRANGAIVHFQFRQRLAGIKMEIMEYEIAGSRCGVVRGVGGARGQKRKRDAQRMENREWAEDKTGGLCAAALKESASPFQADS